MRRVYALLAILAFSHSAALADSGENEVGGHSMDLREALMKDFDLSLPIIGQLGESGSRDDPIIITTSDPVLVGQAARDTVAGLQRGLSLARQGRGESDMLVGVLWRTLDGGLHISSETGLGVYRIERKVLTPSEVVTETIAYYFDVSAAQISGLDRFETGAGMPVVSLGENLPSEIGWLHYDPDQSVNYAEQHNRPDLGVGAAYGAIGIKATLYLYPGPRTPIDRDALRRQFEQAASDLESNNPNVTAWLDADVGTGNFLRIWRVGDGDQATALALTSYRGHFVKVRTTWYRDQVLDPAHQEFIRVVFSMFSVATRN